MKYEIDPPDDIPLMQEDIYSAKTMNDSDISLQTIIAAPSH